MEKWKAEKYARALVEVGVNILPGEKLLLQADTNAADLSREIVKAAFAKGARDVEVMWSDPETEHTRVMNASPEVLREAPQWKQDGLDSVFSDGKGVLISVHGTYPTLNLDVPDENRRANALSGNDLRNVIRKYIHKAVLKWTGTVYPTVDWAKKVFPEYDEETAYTMLEDALCMMMRIDRDSDPVENWHRHLAELSERSRKLNEYNFKTLHIASELGTDLTMDLVEGHIWVSAGEMGAGNVSSPYVANMPSEEVFTDPDFHSVNGIVYASFPINMSGKLVKGLWMRFENGKAVDCGADEGADALREALFRDETTRQLGEIALVSKQSPIKKTGRIFYNGLIDENAACHIAFGTSFPDCVRGGTEMTREQLIELGVNHSVSHNDIMIGTDDLMIAGITHHGREIPVMEHGDFVL